MDRMKLKKFEYQKQRENKIYQIYKKKRNQKWKIKILIKLLSGDKDFKKLIHKQNFIPYLNEFALQNKSLEGCNNYFSLPYFLFNFCKLWRIKFAIFFLPDVIFYIIK